MIRTCNEKRIRTGKKKRVIMMDVTGKRRKVKPTWRCMDRHDLVEKGLSGGETHNREACRRIETATPHENGKRCSSCYMSTFYRNRDVSNCLQLSIGKTVSAAYHLNNRDAKRELDVFVDNKRMVFQQAPKYLGVRLDRMLNFKQHLEEVAGKVTSRVSLFRRLAGTIWGASAKTLRISTQSLVFPAAE